jgi:hypothetical protein
MIRVPRRSVLGGAIAVIASSVASRSALSAATAQLWQKRAGNDPTSQVVIDHQAWGTFLRRYLVEEPDGINRLRYGEVSAVDRQALERYIENMSKVRDTNSLARARTCQRECGRNLEWRD